MYSGKETISNYSEDSDDSDSEHSESAQVIKREVNLKDSKSGKESESESSSDSSSDSDAEEEVNLKDSKFEKESESESSSDSSSDSDAEEKDEDFDHQWEELRNEAPDTDEVSCRIAVCNMDWDRIRPIDILVCFNSFKPANGCVNSVKIYPSEYGLKRMEEEKLKGPPELVEETLPLDAEEVEDKKTAKYHREKLRQYQISRLKYYYAVVDCDSSETASAIYQQLNGMEYESSSVRYDLRFIPDDMTFDHEPTDSAENVPEDYQPRQFVTSALQQVKVDLTWDETDTKRKEFFHKIFKDPESVKDDISTYLASASSESEEEITVGVDEESGVKLKTKDRISQYKELLKSIEEKEKQEKQERDMKYGNIEVTWEVEPDSKKETKEKVEEKIKNKSLNPFEEMLLKKKEGRKLKKKELKQQQQCEDSDESGEESAENLSNDKAENDKKLAELALISDYKKETKVDKINKKKKEKSENLHGFVPDLNDPRFSAMHTSSLFNMVPTEQHPKKSDGGFSFKQQKGRKFKSSKNNESHKNSKRARYN